MREADGDVYPRDPRCERHRETFWILYMPITKYKSIMTITKSYITDETGNITSVILDYHTYKRIEELLLDEGLLKAMEEVEDEETLDTEEMLFTILVRAASINERIEQTCKTMENVPSAGDIRYHVTKCDDMPTMKKDVNAVLQARLPKGLTRRRQRLAIDLNLQPYYGTPTPEGEGVRFFVSCSL